MKKEKLLLTSLLTFTLISSCSPKDFTQQNLIGLEDFFTQQESSYGVYYFSEDCPMCKDTLPFINEYLAKVERNKYKYTLKNIYFIDAKVTPIEKDLNEDRENFLLSQIGVTKVEDLLTLGYPLLYIVENQNDVNTLIDIKIGRAAVTDYIKTIW